MSNFSQKEFEHLKNLCRIDCSAEEEAKILNSLQNILTYVDQLKEIDTTGIDPCDWVLQTMLKNQMRNDEVCDLLPREEFLSNAAEQIGGMVRVLPIMKSE